MLLQVTPLHRKRDLSDLVALRSALRVLGRLVQAATGNAELRPDVGLQALWCGVDLIKGLVVLRPDLMLPPAVLEGTEAQETPGWPVVCW